MNQNIPTGQGPPQMQPNGAVGFPANEISPQMMQSIPNMQIPPYQQMGGMPLNQAYMAQMYNPAMAGMPPNQVQMMLGGVPGANIVP